MLNACSEESGSPLYELLILEFIIRAPGWLFKSQMTPLRNQSWPRLLFLLLQRVSHGSQFQVTFWHCQNYRRKLPMVFKHFFKNYSFRKRSLKPIFHNSTETQNWRELVCNNANKRGNFLAFHRSISQKKRKHFCVFLKSYKNYILESLGGLEIAFFVFSFSETFTRVYQFFCISMRTREMFFYFICKLAIQTIEK